MGIACHTPPSTRKVATRAIEKRPLRVVDDWTHDASTNRWESHARSIYLADQLIVRAASGVGPPALASHLRSNDMALDRQLSDNLYTVRLPSADLDAVPDALEALAGNPLWILEAEADGIGFGAGIPQ